MKYTLLKKTLQRHSLRALAACSIVAAQQGIAQDDTDDSEDTVFELSPFVIEANSDIGYLATQTLSGSRMRSNLGDVGASVDVLTDEFLRDLAAVDMFEALDFVGNVETYGVSGGHSDVENEVWFSEPYTARGFQSGSRMTDFFTRSKASMDFYNLTNFTVVRGPNAVLFGIGNPGGVVNASRKRAIFGEAETELSFRIDNYGSLRTTLDTSREIIEDKLAVRFALLNDDRNEFLDPAGHKREAAFGTFTYRPFEKTSITVSGEVGTEDRTFRFSNMIYDGVTRWVDAGSPSLATPSSPKDYSFGSGLDDHSFRHLVISGQPEIEVLDWNQAAQSERFEIDGHPNIGTIRRTSYTKDTAIWDYDGVQLVGNSRERELEWDDFTVLINQQLFTPDLNVELGYNYATTEYIMAHSFGQQTLFIDPNEQLPNGDPNPNFGSPYVEADRSEVIGEQNQHETYRATLSYNLDLNEKIGRGFGRYSLMGLWEDETKDDIFEGFRHSFYDVENGRGAIRNPIFNGLNRVSTRTYVQTDLNPEEAVVEPYYKQAFAAIDQDGLSSYWIRHTSPRDIRTHRESTVVAAQAYLWPTEKSFDRLILTYGRRSDEQTSQRKNYVRDNFRGFAPEAEIWRGSPWEMDAATERAFWSGHTGGVLGEASVFDEPTSSYSAIFKPLRDLSLYYNYSDVLLGASSLQTDIYGRFLDPTFGETNDFGVRWRMNDNKLVTSLTFFETAAKNQQQGGFRNSVNSPLSHIWEVVDPDAQIHQGFDERWTALQNDSSDGIEFSLTANLLPGWSTRLSVSKVNTVIESRLPIVDEYIAEFLPLWQQNLDLPLSENVQSDPNYLTVGDALENILTDVADYHALENTVPRSQRAWKVVMNTNYRFNEGKLKGFAVGGGFRWNEGDTVGYAYDDELDDQFGLVVVDSTKPFAGEELFSVSAHASYSAKLWNRDVRFQLNIRNLLNEDGTFPRQAIDDLTGSPYYTRQQVREPRSFVFTTTFDF